MPRSIPKPGVAWAIPIARVLTSQNSRDQTTLRYWLSGVSAWNGWSGPAPVMAKICIVRSAERVARSTVWTKVGLIDRAAARTGDQNPAGGHHLGGQTVQVRVFSQARLQHRPLGHELRRIDHHHVPPAALFVRLAEEVEGIGVGELDLDLVQFGVLFGQDQGLLVQVHGRDLGGAALGGRVDGKAAGVAADVEHPLARRELREGQPVVALVAEKARLVALL